MTALALAVDGERPIPIDPSLGAALGRRFHALMGGTVLPHDLALTPSYSLLLQARATRLDASLRPAPERAVAIAISGVLGILSSRNPDAGDAAVQRRAYMAAVEGVPGFAVIGACDEALKAGIGDKRFAPTPPELLEAALALAHPVRMERARIAAVLGADVADPPSSPERRRELAAAARRAFHIPEGGLPESPAARSRARDEHERIAAHANRVVDETRSMRAGANATRADGVAA